MTAPSRRLETAARRLADQNSNRLRDAAQAGDKFIATVTAVTAGAASDGNATVTVAYRSASIVASGWNVANTFAVGQRVMCCWLVPGQVFVEYPIGGQP